MYKISTSKDHDLSPMTNKIEQKPEIKPVNYEQYNFHYDEGSETIWRTKDQIASVFQVDRATITKHINNIIKDGELDEKSNVQKMHIANSDKPVKQYNLELENKTYSVGGIANYFLKKSWEGSNNKITPMKLQKLVYFAFGWSTVYLDKRLINEPIKAWEFGPVCSSIYHEFKLFGGNQIPKENFMSEIQLGDISKGCNGRYFTDSSIVTNMIDDNDSDVKELLDSVWNVYSKYDATTLSSMTHNLDDDNPWIKAREIGKREGIIRGRDISQEDVKSYFEKLKKEKRLY